MMARRLISSILVLGMVLSGAPQISAAPAVSALPEGVGLLTYVEGRVDRHAGADYFPVIREEAVSVGDTIRTKSFSRAEIVFNDKSVLRVGENSQVQIRDYTLKNGKRENARLVVDRGKVRVIVSKAANGKENFAIDTPNAEGSVRGSDICVSFLKSSTSILALDGEIAAKSLDFPEQPIIVQRGTTAYVPYKAPPFGPRAYMQVEQKKFESDTNPRPSTPDMSGVRKAIVAKFVGPVRVHAAGTGKWHAPAIKEALGPGDEIETGPNGKAQLVLESGRVINLRPLSHLKIKKLSRDTKTGSLEDIFESKLGEIRAKVDKKKQGSKFEISSPVAIAAVRGTILYLFVKNTGTRSYFEQGNGMLANLVKKAEMELTPGQNGSIGSDGSSTGPNDTTDKELDELEKMDWEIEDDTYGYTPPTGSDYIPPFRDLEDENETPQGTTDQPFEEIKPELGGESGDSLSELFLQLFGIWGGEDNESSLYANDGGNFQWTGEEFGDILAAVFPWTSSQPFVVFGGQFFEEVQDSRPRLFNSIITSELPGAEVESTSDGGAFFGYTAGLWTGVEGVFAALFVDPSGNIGILTGDTNGSFDNETGTWSASGVFTPTVFGNDQNIDPDFFSSSFGNGYAYGAMLAGDFGGDGYLGADLTWSRVMFLQDVENPTLPSHNFGIYNFRYSDGYFYQGEGSDFSAMTGGLASFGFYRPTESYYFSGDYGYWLAEVNGSFDDGDIRGQMAGAFLSQTRLGVLAGGVSGLANYSEYGGDFILQSVGAYQSEPLSFFSYLEGDLDGIDESEGSFEAYFGGVDSVLVDGGTADVFVIGGFYQDSETGDQQIWRNTVTSYNAIEGGVESGGYSNTTYNGGAYYAFMAGNHLDGDMKGAFAGLYVGPQNAEETAPLGFLTGNLSGEAFDEIEMFAMDGQLHTREMDGSGIGAENFTEDNIWLTYGEGTLIGSFENGGGSIGGFDEFETASIVDENNGYASDFGIYRQSFNRTFYSNLAESSSFSGFMGGNDPFGYRVVDEEGYSFYQDNGYWMADVENGEWENDGFHADLSGKFLTWTRTGTLNGEIFGVYEGYGGSGEWNAYGVGTWEGALLDFTGQVLVYEGEGTGDFAKFYGEGFDVFGSMSESIMGGTGSLASESSILLMGFYNANEHNEPILWGIDLQSYNVNTGGLTTFSGDGFFGFAGGRFANGEVTGNGSFIYILNDGNYEESYSAGVFSGGLDGSYEEFSGGNGMWQASGDFSGTQYGSTSYAPEWLNSSEASILTERELTGSGFLLPFNGENFYMEGAIGGFLVNLDGQEYGTEWGIWAGFIGGYYEFQNEGPVNGDFRLGFGAIAGEEYGYSEEYPIYIAGVVTGNFDAFEDSSAGTVDAEVNGVWISEQGTSEEQFVTVGTINGQAAGDFSGEGAEGTWESAAVGEWAAIAELDKDAIGFSQIQDILSNVAVSEIFNSTLTGAGSFGEGGGSITGTMDTSFFSGIELGGFWTAIFNGSFAGLPEGGSGWSASFANEDVTAQLTNGSWNNGQWIADVSGSVNGGVDFSGQAGGTYTTNETDPASGNFTGVGVGTWQGQGQCQECV